MSEKTEQKVYCSGCGKDISIKPYTLVSGIYEASDGKTYCQRCYRIIKKHTRIQNSEESQASSEESVSEVPIEEPQESSEEPVSNEPIEESASESEETPEENSDDDLPKREDYEDYITFCLAYSIAAEVSDLHIKAESNPVIRMFGDIKTLYEEPMSSESIYEFILAYSEQSEESILECIGAIDFAFTYMNVRFRCNAYRDMRGWCVALRLLTIITAEFAALGIPEVLKTLAVKKSGLILITGPTGSGKTTTLSCLVDYMNRTQCRHIIMLEDPIEFVHSNKKSIISQREIGRDTSSYAQAIVEAMREDPDIILVGEMRDRDSIEAAIRAAETGHLVLSTLHTKGAGSTIDRIIDIFPPEQQNQIRTQLALSLIGVVAQQLVPGVSYGRRWLASEVMINNTAIQSLIRQGKTHLITSTIQISKQDGMYTMKSSLNDLLAKGKISIESLEMYNI